MTKPKSFSKGSPLDKLSNTTILKNADIEKESPIVAGSKQQELESEQEKLQVKQKRKVGRPKIKDIKNTCKNINVAVPITLLNKWEEIKRVHNRNLTKYITKLIEKDMDENYDNYKKIINSLNNIL